MCTSCMPLLCDSFYVDGARGGGLARPAPCASSAVMNRMYFLIILHARVCGRSSCEGGSYRLGLNQEHTHGLVNCASSLRGQLGYGMIGTWQLSRSSMRCISRTTAPSTTGRLATPGHWCGHGLQLSAAGIALWLLQWMATSGSTTIQVEHPDLDTSCVFLLCAWRCVL